MRIIAYFVRHGETDMNKKDEFRGDEDITLNDLGHAQAQEIVPYFKGRKFSAAYHSGMQRTKQTLQPLMEDKGMESQGIENLDSLNTGDFTGHPKTKENKEKLEWYRQNPNVIIPGGESVQHFRDRVDPMIYKVIKIGREAGNPTITSVHGSIMREISRLFHEGDYNKIKVEPGGIIGIFENKNGSLDARPLVKENLEEEDIHPGS